MISYTAPYRSSGFSLLLALVSSRRKVVISLCATRMLYICRIGAIFSEVALIVIVVVVTGSQLKLV